MGFAPSDVISRKILDGRLAKMTERYGTGKIPLPSHWAVTASTPEVIGSWQGRQNRLHDRFRYTRQPDGKWHIDRLAP